LLGGVSRPTRRVRIRVLFVEVGLHRLHVTPRRVISPVVRGLSFRSRLDVDDGRRARDARELDGGGGTRETAEAGEARETRETRQEADDEDRETSLRLRLDRDRTRRPATKPGRPRSLGGPRHVVGVASIAAPVKEPARDVHVTASMSRFSSTFRE